MAVATVTTDALADALAAAGVRITRDVAVAELTTYRVGGPVAVLARAGDHADLHAIAGALRHHRVPVVVIGRGSNLLVADRGFDGLGVVLDRDFERLELDDAELDADVDRSDVDRAEGGLVRAGAAVPLPVLARRSAARGRTGLEFFVGIPGSVGGAVRMNAGGHGCDTATVLRSATLLDLATGEDRTVAARALDFGYRHSAVTTATVVTGATFAVGLDDPSACEARVAEIVRWRREHQPGGSNAGSVFRNPPGDSAGRLIDAAGLRGLRVGGAVVSEKHANFFLAEAGARAADVANLVFEVRRRVAARFGVELEPELQMLGFDP